MVINKKLLVGYKLFLGLLGFASIVTEISVLVQRGIFNPVNFFSYFTIENNILVFMTLLLSALYAAAGKHSRALDILRGASTVFILVVGIGFALLLSQIDGIVLTAVPWDNLVLHYIIPVAVLIDYLIDRPTTKLRFVPSLSWLLFPAAYLVYSLIRGALTGWYPYPFLDPAHGGYGAIAVVVCGLLVLGTVLIVGVTKLSGKKSARRPR